MGKSSVVYVIGLSLLVGYGLMNINENSTSSMDTYADYYGNTMVHNVAVTGANVGTQLLMRTPTYTGDLLSQPFGTNGWYDMRLTRSGKTATIVSVGRFTVPISPDFPDGYLRDTVIAGFKYVPFSEFGYFSERENNGYMGPADNTPPSTGSMYKVTGDSMFGYAHTNQQWNLGGRPYFNDKVTARNSPTYLAGGFGGLPNNPIYNGGYQWGITVNRPAANIPALQAIANAGINPVVSSVFTNTDVGLEFFSNGNVHVRVPYNTGLTKDTTMPVSGLTSNQVIGVNSGDLHIKGTYTGQLTVAAFKGTSGASTRKGNVWIDGDIIASDNPYTNPNSTDMMGIVAQRMTYLTTTGIPRTAASVVNIQAAIYCHDGVFAAENYSTVVPSGRINLFGGVTMAASTSTGRISGGVLTNGFLKSIRHDPRFLTTAPPSFPASDKYKLVSWWEN